jgi:carbon-monoxide dehydrogenase large subunit
MEYAVPKADMLPSFETDRTVTPTPVNPLGVKGAGETGTIASPVAVVNAVMDALAPFGITHVDMPLTPAKIWRAVRDARARGDGGEGDGRARRGQARATQEARGTQQASRGGR